jgi:hypothetical protein
MARFSLRDFYSFADFNNEVADAVCEKLNEVELPGNGKFFIRRAIALGSQREEGGRRGGGEQHRDARDSEGDFADSDDSGEEMGSFEEQDEMGNQ